MGTAPGHDRSPSQGLGGVVPAAVCCLWLIPRWHLCQYSRHLETPGSGHGPHPTSRSKGPLGWSALQRPPVSWLTTWHISPARLCRVLTTKGPELFSPSLSFPDFGRVPRGPAWSLSLSAQHSSRPLHTGPVASQLQACGLLGLLCQAGISTALPSRVTDSCSPLCAVSPGTGRPGPVGSGTHMHSGQSTEATPTQTLARVTAASPAQQVHVGPAWVVGKPAGFP